MFRLSGEKKFKLTERGRYISFILQNNFKSLRLSPLVVLVIYSEALCSTYVLSWICRLHFNYKHQSLYLGNDIVIPSLTDSDIFCTNLL